MKHFLGIDTSNYTTSVAICDETALPSGKRRLLPVREGERGLRQSDALFHHTKALPLLIRELTEEFSHENIAAVGVSGFPRRVRGSYMPCFLAGVSVAASTAAFFDVPLYIFSHQEGHLEAAKLGSGMEAFPEYLAFHLSGGTLELLRVREEDGEIRAEIRSDSADITAGQLIDRCGVKLGLGFPCGAELEKLAMEATEKFKVKIPLRDGRVSISGLENRFDKLMQEGASRENCAGFVFDCVKETVRAMADGAENLPLLFMGGVASSVLLKNAFSSRKDCYFSPAAFSCDNALGVAALARKSYFAGKAPDRDLP